MQMDPRCKRVNELSAQYHQLFRALTEKYLIQQCQESDLEPLCIGDYSFLFIAGKAEECVSMSDVARRLNVHASTATRQANRLLSAGLITKSSAPGDDRRYEIRLTDAGRRLLEQIEDRQYRAVQATYDQIPDQELQAVYRYLEKSIDALHGLLGDG